MKNVIWALILASVFCTLGWMSTALGQTMDSAELDPAPESQVEEVLSFERWRGKQIEAAQVTLDVAAADRNVQKRSSNRSTRRRSSAEGLDSRHEQAKLNLEVAKELALHDYFVLYAARLTRPEDFQKVVSHLTQDQAALLLKAYADELMNSRVGEFDSTLEIQSTVQLLNQ